MYLVVGLRNPGPDYEGTRHNIGYEAVAKVLERVDASLKRAPLKLNGRMAKSGVGDDQVVYFISNRFMNETGASVRAAAVYFKVAPSRLLVAHDDIDLPFGRLRLQVGGGSGGHNGVRSIEAAAGTNDFSRLKIGVGRPPGSMDPSDFVLRPFHRAERPEVDLMVEVAADVIERWPDDPARAQEIAARYDSD
jgi:peptidyl-tRNA hydrolase, PTH1 family